MATRRTFTDSQPLPASPSGAGGQHQQYSHSHVEEENTRAENQLADKVKALKSLTIDIGDEIRYDVNIIKGMDDDFDRSTGFLSSTMNRLTAISRSGSNWHMCYLLLFCVCVFFFLWLVLKFR